jgi:hypothetical protein
MDYRITGLPAETFTPYFAMDAGELARHRALRRTVDTKPGAPCRVSLQDAEPGEEVILLNYEHLGADSPYRASHAIYVRPLARATYDRVNEVPDMLASRLLSVRAFDADHLMVACDVVEGRGLVELVERLLADPRATYLHAHFARAGCYAARITRAD